MRKGKIKEEKINVFAFCGDLGGHDMGIGGISGALQSDLNLLIIMYDNESAANTDIQATGLTTFGAHTTFTPPGKKYSIMLIQRSETPQTKPMSGQQSRVERITVQADSRNQERDATKSDRESLCAGVASCLLTAYKCGFNLLGTRNTSASIGRSVGRDRHNVRGGRRGGCPPATGDRVVVATAALARYPCPSWVPSIPASCRRARR
jgi:hypothetical protein